MSWPEEWNKAVAQALLAPFPDDEIEFLPRASVNGRALALAHIDARSVMRRLDAVVGPDGWGFDFEMLSADGKKVKGLLTVLGRLKCDAGEAAAEDEPLKAAVSDALKRCAVHFGIARYLYYLPQLWVPYDAAKRRFTETPRLLAGAVERAMAVCGCTGAAPEAVSRAAAQRAAESSPGRERAKAAMERGEQKLRHLTPSLEVAQANYRRAATAAGWAALDESTRQERFNEYAGRPAECATEAAPAQYQGIADRLDRELAKQAESAPLVCDECRAPVTKGQRDVSLRAFGKSLCPRHQREQARAA